MRLCCWVRSSPGFKLPDTEDEEEGIKNLQNTGNYLPSDLVSCPRRHQSTLFTVLFFFSRNNHNYWYSSSSFIVSYCSFICLFDYLFICCTCGLFHNTLQNLRLCSIEHCYLSLQCSVMCICCTVLCFPRFMLIVFHLYDFGHLSEFWGVCKIMLCCFFL